MILETVFGIVALYLVIGVVVASATGGSDPLDFAPWPVVVGWPAVLVVIVIGLALLPTIKGDEGP